MEVVCILTFLQGSGKVKAKEGRLKVCDFVAVLRVSFYPDAG